MKHSFSAPSGEAVARLDALVADHLGCSRAHARSLCEDGRVRVNGRRGRKGDVPPPSALIECDDDDEADQLIGDPASALRVIWHDAVLVAIDKPAGMASHPLRSGERGTAANALVHLYPEVRTAGATPREGGLCHRLDTPTSGVLLAARNRETWEAIRAQFRAREVVKHYYGVVSGPIADEGVVDLPLVSDGRHSRVADANDKGARQAATKFRVLRRSGAHSLLLLSIDVGVMHQIRAHLAAIGAPLLNDDSYGGPAWPDAPRLFLHACTLGFVHPETNQRQTIACQMPRAMREACGHMGLVDENDRSWSEDRISFGGRA